MSFQRLGSWSEYLYVPRDTTMAGADDEVYGPAPRFPTYLLSSFNIPFRKRQPNLSRSMTSTSDSVPRQSSIPSLSSSPTDSTLSSPVGSPTTTPSPSRFSVSSGGHRTSTDASKNSLKLMRIQPDVFKCSTCSTDLAFTTQIVSKGFTGRYGRALLVSPPDFLTKGKRAGDLMNIKVGKPESRLLVTGQHLVADITCATCHAKLGWKYVDAKEELQKYKVGKFILETQRVTESTSWEAILTSEMAEINMDGELRHMSCASDESIIFDSGDEDECEDLFCGLWDPQTAAIRRKGKFNRLLKQTYE